MAEDERQRGQPEHRRHRRNQAAEPPRRGHHAERDERQAEEIHDTQTLAALLHPPLQRERRGGVRLRFRRTGGGAAAGEERRQEKTGHQPEDGDDHIGGDRRGEQVGIGLERPGEGVEVRAAADVGAGELPGQLPTLRPDRPAEQRGGEERAEHGADRADAEGGEHRPARLPHRRQVHRQQDEHDGGVHPDRSQLVVGRRIPRQDAAVRERHAEHQTHQPRAQGLRGAEPALQIDREAHHPDERHENAERTADHFGAPGRPLNGAGRPPTRGGSGSRACRSLPPGRTRCRPVP